MYKAIKVNGGEVRVSYETFLNFQRGGTEEIIFDVKAQGVLGCTNLNMDMVREIRNHFNVLLGEEICSKEETDEIIAHLRSALDILEV